MEDEGEIEYLEEDEDLVQQLLQTTQVPASENVASLSDASKIVPEDDLLVERRPDNKRKHEDDDSDYDPTEDLKFQLQQQRKKKKSVRKYSGPNLINNNQAMQIIKKPKEKHIDRILNANYEDKLKSLPNLVVKKQIASKFNAKSSPQLSQERKIVKRISYNDLVERRKLDIRVPDYEDPLCLPVRALRQDEPDIKRLKQWNGLCLDQHRKLLTPMRTTGGVPAKSSRLFVLKNVKDKYGRINTSVYGRTTVTDREGESRAESFQSVLPRYREKKVLANYPLRVGGLSDSKHVYEVVLSKEKEKEEETLVVYKPKEKVSAVYKFLEKDQDASDGKPERKKVLVELTCAKVCAPCYQTSWRGISKDTADETLPCSICNRPFTSVYSLLTHLKNVHSHMEVRKAKAQISKTLAKMVQYHYKCRICQKNFVTITELRRHVASTHRGVEVFKCEVGDHMAS